MARITMLLLVHFHHLQRLLWHEQLPPAPPQAQIDACAAAISKILLEFDQRHEPHNHADLIWNLEKLLGIRDDAAKL